MDKVGKYKILKELGRGATSVVYLALDAFGQREVALKVLFPDALDNPDYGKRYKKLFVTEASLAGKLSHPHIVAIYDAGESEGVSYIVMEYVPGETLEAYCRAERLLPIHQVLEIAFKCCKALDYAHRMGVIHRDIKPANILMNRQGDIKISDFGAALTASAESTQVSGIGSPAYMSPEQIQERSLTHQTDIYSLGVVVYQLLTGTLPFKATNNYSMIYQILNVDPQPSSVFRPEIPAAVDVIVKQALQKDSAARYRTWDEFAQALSSVFQNLAAPAEVVPDAEKFNVLRGLSFFRQFGDVELWEVLRIAIWNKYSSAAPIVREGEVGRVFYVLAAGDVKVTKEGKLLNILKPGECFGEMAYLGKRKFQRTASVATAGPATVIEIDPEALAAASEGCRHRFTEAFLEILVDRLAMANTRLSQLLLDRNISFF